MEPPALSLAADPVTLPQPVDLSAPLWLLPPVAQPETIVLVVPQGYLVSPALPWSDVTLPAPQTYEPSNPLCLSTPSAPSGSNFPPAPPRSLVPYSYPRHPRSSDHHCRPGFSAGAFSSAPCLPPEPPPSLPYLDFIVHGCTFPIGGIMSQLGSAYLHDLCTKKLSSILCLLVLKQTYSNKISKNAHFGKNPC